jgi:hypothetical protein
MDARGLSGAFELANETQHIAFTYPSAAFDELGQSRHTT